MKLKWKLILPSLILLATAVLFCGCTSEGSPYEKNDAEGKTLSVCFDANGGYFTTNTSIIVDSYDPSKLPTEQGKATVALLSPDDKARGNDAFAPINNGYFLAGWYAERTETLDDAGNACYVYGKKWDFQADRLEVDANGSYSSSKPVLTLYAAWVPLFTVEFYDKDSGEHLSTLSFDPTQGNSIKLPEWSEETGAVEMYKFPKKNGYTYNEVYYEQSDEPISEAEITHCGQVDITNGTAKNPVLKLNVSYREGEWYRVSTVEQLLKNANVNGSYEICADLDFTDAIWPTALMYGNYSGTILGNGYTFSNIKLTQTNNSKVNAGLFGMLTDTASISDLTLENVSFTIQSGTRVAGTCYGLLAGTVSDKAQLQNVSVKKGSLQIDSDCYFGTDEYAIGLLCGSGTVDVDASDITVEAVGSAPENVKITLDGQNVNVDIELN